MVKHVVTFKLSGSAEERLDTARRFKAALLALPGKIEVLKCIEVGINENPNEEWDVTLIASVPTMGDVATYAKHPAHVEATTIIANSKVARACVDYEI